MNCRSFIWKLSGGFHVIRASLTQISTLLRRSLIMKWILHLKVAKDTETNKKSASLTVNTLFGLMILFCHFRPLIKINRFWADFGWATLGFRMALMENGFKATKFTLLNEFFQHCYMRILHNTSRVPWKISKSFFYSLNYFKLF